MTVATSTKTTAKTTTTRTRKRAANVGKGKKRTLKRATVSTDLIPLKDETWLLQPIAVTMMRHDYSLIQIRILVAIIQFMQSSLHDILNKVKSAPELFRENELDPDGKIEIRTLFKDLGIDPNHYPDLRYSLRMLSTVPVDIPYKTHDGRHYQKYTTLCDVYIPEGPGIYQKYAILKMDPDVARRLVSLDFGYHHIGKEIVFACHNRYTQRIYMFIESWLKKGFAVIDTLEFRKMLRLETNYKKFSDFCRRVLEPAKTELKAMAENGFCDCYFDYEKKYLHGQRGGEPDQLVFHISRSKILRDTSVDKVSEIQRQQFVNWLVHYFSFDQKMAEKMSERITPENYQNAVKKTADLLQHIRSMPNLHDRAAYAYRSLDNFFNGVAVTD